MVSLFLNKSQLMSSSQYKVVPIRIHLLKKKHIICLIHTLDILIHILYEE